MSLIPLLFSEWWEDLEHPHTLPAQNFGLGLRPEQLLQPARSSLYLDSIPRQNATLNNQLKALLELLQQRETNGPSAVAPAPPAVNKDDFQVVLDVQQFEPHEIDVKVVDDYLVVTAKHEDKRDEHGWVSRQFVRKCKLPENSNVEQLTSRLSSDGVLTIVAPKKRPLKEETERTIQIERTGKPFVSEQQEKSKSKKPKQSNDEKKKE